MLYTIPLFTHQVEILKGCLQTYMDNLIAENPCKFTEQEIHNLLHKLENNLEEEDSTMEALYIETRDKLE